MKEECCRGERREERCRGAACRAVVAGTRAARPMMRERHAGCVSMVMGRGGARCFDWWTVGAGLSGAAGGVRAWRSRAGRGGRGWMACGHVAPVTGRGGSSGCFVGGRSGAVVGLALDAAC